MNDSEIEDQLRALAPAPPSVDLAARIEHELHAPPRALRTAGVIGHPKRPSQTWRWLRDLGWAVAGATAMLAVLTHFSSPDKHDDLSAAVPAPVSEASIASAAPPAAEQAFEPAETSRELVSVNNSDELLDTADGP